MSVSAKTDAEIAFEERYTGKARNGEVHLRDFDRGVVETFGGVIYQDPDPNCEHNGNYFLTNVPYLKGPPGMPGVPVNFAFPEDLSDVFVYPMVLITREDISPATNRYHPGTQQYRVPAIGSLPAVAQWGNKTATGWNRMADRGAPVPYDISYTIGIYAYRRGDTPGANLGVKGQANALLEYVLAWYQPYTAIDVYDSVGDRRVYFATVDSASPMDDVMTVAERTIGWTISMVVEAELDLTQERSHPTALTGTLNLSRK